MPWLDRLTEIRDRDWSEAPPSERDAKAHEVVQISAYASAAAAVVPVPLAELALLVPIHTAMVMSVGHVYGRPVSRTEAARVVVELGAIAGMTMAGTAARSFVRKLLLPGVGGLLAAPASFALTWGLGRVAMDYFDNPSLSREQLRVVFKEAMAEGRKLFSKERFDEFRQKYGEGGTVVDAAEAHVDAEPGPAEEASTRAEAVDVHDAEVVSDDGPREPPSAAGSRRPRRKL